MIKRWEILSKDFPNMAKLAHALLVLPYTTAPVESTFSEFKAFKTCYRNRINVLNLEASILAEQEFKLENPKIFPKMIEKYLNMWKPKAKANPIEKAENNEILAQKGSNDIQNHGHQNVVYSKGIYPVNESSQDFFSWSQPMLSALYSQWNRNSNHQHKNEVIPIQDIQPLMMT